MSEELEDCTNYFAETLPVRKGCPPTPRAVVRVGNRLSAGSDSRWGKPVLPITMTQSATAPLGCRENFWGENDSDEQIDEPEASYGVHHGKFAGTEKLEWVSHSLLKQFGDATLACPNCLDAGIVNEVTEPQNYVEPSDVEVGEDADGEPVTIELYADWRAKRNCPSCGTIHGGVVLDRPAEEFLELVDVVLEAADDYPDSRRDRVRRRAQSRKDRGRSDKPNLRKTLYELTTGDFGGN